MKRNSLFLIFSLLIPLTLQAQTDFRPGYVIRMDGDTLFGHVDYRGDILMSRQCKFQGAVESEDRTYFPWEIAGYRFTDSKYYVSREVDGTNVFVEFLIKGEINIYYLRDDSGDRYFLNKQQGPLIEIPYEEGQKYRDEKQYYYQSTKHYGILKLHTQNAPSLVPQIMRIEKPSHENLIQLAQEYHEEVCEEGECIIYERQPPAAELKLELAGRLVHYRNKIDEAGARSDLANLNYAQWGAYVHIGAPRINERFFFKTGLSVFPWTMSTEQPDI